MTLRSQVTRGVTLVELIVASALFSLLFLVLIKVLFPALGAWKDGQKRAELSQSLQVTCNWLADDLTKSAPSTPSQSNDGVLSLRCANRQRAGHSNDFNELVAYWIQNENLVRSRSSASESAGPPALKLVEVQSMERRRIARGVSHFQASFPRPWLTTIELQLTVGERQAEIRSTFASIYAPLDLAVAQKEQDSEYSAP